jgi:hypothetical protein
MSWLRAVFELALFLVSLVSRALNVIGYKGSPYQTFSARCHMLAPKSVEWDRRRRYVNALFFWQDDHCLKAHSAEIDRALNTLRANGITQI